ncbi:hypothetical protein [Thalassoglobus polymorphus]|nr:hypothetical protein [Thalassoglobus polymorphus]
MLTSTPMAKPSLSAMSNVPEPVMKVNSFDRLSAGMIAFVFGLILVVIGILLWWASTRVEKPTFLVPMEMVEVGGEEDGAPDETLQIESPEDPNENPSPTEEVLEEAELTDFVEDVVELADVATQQVNAIPISQPGTPGSAVGTGRKRLGNGPGNSIPNEERWFIRYSDKASVDEYAKQLDYFGIEMGALIPSGQLILMSNMSAGSPKKTTKSSGKGETRLYMTWQAGNRKAADETLFKKINVDVSDAILFHFYPKKTEQMLLQLEYDYAKRKASEIRRTYFVVAKKGSGYQFVVTRQTYLR